MYSNAEIVRAVITCFRFRIANKIPPPVTRNFRNINLAQPPARVIMMKSESEKRKKNKTCVRSHHKFFTNFSLREILIIKYTTLIVPQNILHTIFLLYYINLSQRIIENYLKKLYNYTHYYYNYLKYFDEKKNNIPTKTNFNIIYNTIYFYT